MNAPSVSMNGTQMEERRSLDRSTNRIQAVVYETSKGWCVRWRSDRMPAPSFFYYDDEKNARREAMYLQRPIPVRGAR